MRVREGAPFPLTGTLSATGGTASAATFRIERGQTESSTLTVSPDTAGEKVTVSVDTARLDATFGHMPGFSFTYCVNAGWVSSWNPNISAEI